MNQKINKFDVTFNAIEKYPLFNKMHLFYQNSEMDLNSDYPFYKKHAEEFIADLPENEQEEINKNPYVEFFEEGVFICSDNIANKDDFYLHVFGFQNFYRAVNNVLTGYEPISLNDKGAERSPENFFRYMKEMKEQKRKDQNRPRSKGSYHLLFED